MILHSNTSRQDGEGNFQSIWRSFPESWPALAKVLRRPLSKVSLNSGLCDTSVLAIPLRGTELSVMAVKHGKAAITLTRFVTCAESWQPAHRSCACRANF